MIYTIFIIPIVIIIAGFFMYKYPPKKPNWFIGYRTRNSMKEQKTWEIANKYCGELFIKTGFITLIISLLLRFLSSLKIIKISEKLVIIITIIQLVLIITSGIIVENKIKNNKPKR